MRPQNTQDTRPTLDNTADQILAKLKLPLGENEARAVVEALEKMLEPKYPMSLDVRRRCFRGLVKLCGEYGVLPGSHIISESKVHKLGDPFTSGGFSYVWPGMYGEAGDGEDEDEGRCVAIKVIQYSELDDIQTIRKNFCREVITWKRLSHPNILELIGVMMNEKEYSMVSPWMDNGNIMEFLREDLQANPLKLLEDAARGLEYLHGMGLAHGDLKGENILISGEERACLADIGLTRVAGELNSVLSSTSTTNGSVTARWCPRERLYPEMFGSKTGSRPTKRSDIYSMAMTIYEVLTDRIPFYEYNDYAATVHIIRGEPPKKPIFFITRGYTQELWDMTITCWDVEPNKRPTIDRVLGALMIAAERWKPKHGGFSTQDDGDQTASEEESDPPTDLEPEDESVDDTPGSPDPPQPLVIETPAPAPPPVPPPSTAKDSAQLESTPIISKEETKSAPAIPPQEEQESRPKAVIPGKEGMELESVRVPREERHDPTPVPLGDADIQVVPIVPPKQEKRSKPGSVAVEDKATRPAPDRQSREEELSSTPTIPTKPLPAKQSTEEGSKPALPILEQGARHASTSLSEAQSKPTSRDKIGEAVPPASSPPIPRKGDTNPTLVGPLKKAPPEPNPVALREETASSTTDNRQEQGQPSPSTPATSLRDDKYTSINTSKAKTRPDPIPDTLEQGAKEVSHECIDGTSSKKKEAMSVITSPPRAGGMRSVLDQGETGSVPKRDPQKVEPRLKEGPTGHESDPRQCSGHVHR